MGYWDQTGWHCSTCMHDDGDEIVRLNGIISWHNLEIAALNATIASYQQQQADNEATRDTTITGINALLAVGELTEMQATQQILAACMLCNQQNYTLTLAIQNCQVQIGGHNNQLTIVEDQKTTVQAHLALWELLGLHKPCDHE